MSTRAWFLILNVLGGTAVLGSYYWGFISYPELRSAFWGGVPESLRGIYTLNMFFAAAGYIAAFGFFMAKLPADGFGRLLWPYFLILIPSALWLPLTVSVLLESSTWLWWLTRIDLFLVAIGGIWVTLAVWHTDRSALRVFVCIAMGFFILQTAVLDAMIWPAFFELPAA